MVRYNYLLLYIKIICFFHFYGDYMKSLLLLLFSLLLIGCGGSTSYLTYQSKPSHDTFNYYSNGIPITEYSAENELYLISTQETSLFGDTYIRVWLLIQNNSDTSQTIEPFNMIRLNGIVKADYYTKKNEDYILITKQDTIDLKPKSPTIILNEIDEKKNTAMIMTSIGGALKALNAKETTIRDNNGNEYRVNDIQEKREQINEKTNNELQNTTNWYGIFENSFNAGVLRVNTLFPHKAINGYVYFQLPSEIYGSGDASSPNIRDIQFKIKLILGNNIKIISIKPYAVW